MCAQSCLCNSMAYSLKPLCPWESLGKNTEVDCRSPLQGVFLIQVKTGRASVQGGLLLTALPVISRCHFANNFFPLKGSDWVQLLD